jgi:sugar/nucleoside kinase (ribokinase family)
MPNQSQLQQGSPQVVALGGVVFDIIGSVSDKTLPHLPSGEPDMANILGRKLKASGPIVPNVGGGAANVAVNLKHQGLRSAILGRLADDLFGNWVQAQLSTMEIDLRLLQVQHVPENAPSDYPLTTGISQVISLEGFDRTINTWKGAGDDLKLGEVNWELLAQAQGLYISNFTSLQHPDFLAQVVEKARTGNVAIAFNPGKSQISQGIGALGDVLQRLDILSVNLGEAQDLAGVSHDTPVDTCLKALHQSGPKVILITDGKRGAYAYDGTTRYHAPVYSTTVKSTLGAGDCFGSTFMAAYLEAPTDIPRALLRASANAASVVSQVGAQVGLLSPEEIDRWIAEQPDVSVETYALS